MWWTLALIGFIVFHVAFIVAVLTLPPEYWMPWLRAGLLLWGTVLALAAVLLIVCLPEFLMEETDETLEVVRDDRSDDAPSIAIGLRDAEARPERDRDSTDT